MHPEAWSESRTSRTLELVGRLRPDTTIYAVQAELSALAESMSEEYPRAYQWGEEKMGIGAIPLLDGLVGNVDRTLFVFFGAALLLLRGTLGQGGALHLGRQLKTNLCTD